MDTSSQIKGPKWSKPVVADITHRLGSQAEADRITDIHSITVKNLNNPFIFYKLFTSAESDSLIEWMQNQELLRNSYYCVKCKKKSVIVRRVRRRECLSYRCSGNNNCETSIRKDSFFEHFRLSLGDIFLFLINYLDGVSIYKSALRSGNCPSNTGTRWGQIIRQIMMHRVHLEYFANGYQFTSTCQLDECCLSRRVKFHRGSAVGPVAWIWGCCCVATGRILILPVINRSAATLVPIIEKYICKGTKVLTDGWGAYGSLNAIGYEAYSVNHSNTFQIQYYSPENNKIEIVDTNMMEGFWGHLRTFFRRRNGRNQ